MTASGAATGAAAGPVPTARAGVLLTVAVLMAVVGLAGVAAPARAATYGPLSWLPPANPAAPAAIVDPSVTRPDPYATWDPQRHEYVMLTSATQYGLVPAWTAPTMTGPWTWAGDALAALPWWSTDPFRTWKPSVALINGVWTLWGTAGLGSTQSLCLYRATGPTSTGPFTVDSNPALGPAAFCSAADGGDIDPQPIHADGSWWLTWKYNGNVTGRTTAILTSQLGLDGLPVGPTHTLLVSDMPWETGLVESPSFVQNPSTGQWWLTFSGGDFGKAKTYQIAATLCAALTGPCSDAFVTHLVASNAQGPGPGEQSTFTDVNGATWMLYNPAGPFTDPGLRPLALVRLGFDSRGYPYVGNPAAAPPSIPPTVVGMATSPSNGGYWLADQAGYVTAHGNAQSLGTMAQSGLVAPITHIVATPDGRGYWLVGADGGIFTFGDAGFFGSTGALHLNAPITGMAPTPDGRGYWLVGADGGVFAFGDAPFWGSMGGRRLNAPVVGIAGDAVTGGYWLVGSDGGIFAYKAPFYGSTGAQHLNAAVNGITGTPDGKGYLSVASDGGIFAYGSAVFHGSMGGQPLNAPIAGIALDTATGGYWLVGADGGIFSFGAPFYGAG